MTQQVLIHTTQLVFSVAAVLLAHLAVHLSRRQQCLQSVGWHGGKTKR